MIQVVAAVIRRGEKILICQRPQGKNLAGFWEFPGGKVEAGESLPDALVRECREELNIKLNVGREIRTVAHDYGSYAVNIHFFECTADGEAASAEHQAIEWVAPAQLKKYCFCPADSSLIEQLSDG